MPFIHIDSETSGLFDYEKAADAPGQPRLASVGMIFTNNNLEIEAEHEFLIKPDGWVFDDNCEAAKVNGLTHERLMAEGVPISDVLPLYAAAIDASRIVSGFNVSFDIKVLRAELRHAGLEDRFMKTKTCCTMWGSRAICLIIGDTGKVKNPKLNEAAAFFGIDVADGHTALADARRSLLILRALKERNVMPEIKDPYNKKPKTKKALKRPKPNANGDEDQNEIPI